MNDADINHIIGKQVNLAKTVFDRTKDLPEGQRLKIYEEINKDLRTIEINQQKQSEKPTEKQIEYARKLGIDSPEKYSKRELSERINDAAK